MFSFFFFFFFFLATPLIAGIDTVHLRKKNVHTCSTVQINLFYLINHLLCVGFSSVTETVICNEIDWKYNRQKADNCTIYDYYL